MYTLPTEPTASDIIKRSITCHPSLFAEAIQARYAEDMAYSEHCHPASELSVKASAQAANRGLMVITQELSGPDDLENYIKAEMMTGIILLGIACKLQCLPRHIGIEATNRTWPQA